MAASTSNRQKVDETSTARPPGGAILDMSPLDNSSIAGSDYGDTRSQVTHVSESPSEGVASMGGMSSSGNSSIAGSNSGDAPSQVLQASEALPMEIIAEEVCSIEDEINEENAAEDEELLKQAIALSETLQVTEKKEDEVVGTHVCFNKQEKMALYFAAQETASQGKDLSVNNCGVEVFGSNRIYMLDTITVCLMNPARAIEANQIFEGIGRQLIEDISLGDDPDRKEYLHPGQVLAFKEICDRIISLRRSNQNQEADLQEKVLFRVMRRLPEVVDRYLTFVFTYKIGGVINPKLTVIDLQNFAIAAGYNLVIYQETGEICDNKKVIVERLNYKAPKADAPTYYVLLGLKNDHYQKMVFLTKKPYELKAAKDRLFPSPPLSVFSESKDLPKDGKHEILFEAKNSAR